MRIDRAIERISQKRAEVVRKSVGIDALALYEAGIAERCLLGGSAAIHENDCPSTLLEVQRYTYADDTCAKHDDIGTRRERERHQHASGARLRKARKISSGLVPP